MKPSEAIRLGLARNPIPSRDVFCAIVGGVGCACVLGCILDRDGKGEAAQLRYDYDPDFHRVEDFDVLVDDLELKVFSVACSDGLLDDIREFAVSEMSEEAWKEQSRVNERSPLSIGHALIAANDSFQGDESNFDPRPAIADILEKHGY